MPKLKSVPAVAHDDQLLTSAQLAVLYSTTERAIVAARSKRAAWMPTPRYLGSRVLYSKAEALAMLQTKVAA